MSHGFPKKFEVRIADGDLSYGYHEVYDAKEVDEWLEKLRKFLTDKAYDRRTVQHGNVALRILNEFFKRPSRDLALDLEDSQLSAKVQGIVREYAKAHPGEIVLPCEKHHRLLCLECEAKQS